MTAELNSSEPDVFIRARFVPYNSTTLASAVALLRGFDDLFAVTASSTQIPAAVSRLLPTRPVFEVPSMREVRRPIPFNAYLQQNALLLRVSYASPLEVAVAIATGAAALSASAYLVANRFIRLFERVQEARVGKAKADYEVSAYQVLSEELGPPRPGMDIERGQVLRAATALERLSKLEIERTGSPPRVRKIDPITEDELLLQEAPDASYQQGF